MVASPKLCPLAEISHDLFQAYGRSFESDKRIGILTKKLKSGLWGFRMGMKKKERKLRKCSDAQEILA
jgi:hypothetical protein